MKLEMSAQKPVENSETPRVGVFVCHCGFNIASVISVEDLTKYAETLQNVAYAAHMNYPCSRQGQDNMIAAIKNEKLLDSDVVLGFDKQGEIVAIEVWAASKRGLLKTLADLANEKREIAKTILKMDQ